MSLLCAKHCLVFKSAKLVASLKNYRVDYFVYSHAQSRIPGRDQVSHEKGL